MTMSRRNALTAGAASLPALSLFALASRAQSPTAAGTVISPEDPLLAACLFGLGKRQIEVCKFAKTLSQSEEVKQFLQAEIDEQETIKAELEKLGYTPPNVPPRQGGEAGTAGTSGTPVVASVALGKVVIPAPASQQIAIANEVVEQCIANTKARLQKLSGAKLEKCIVGDQLHEHYVLQDHALVFDKHGSPTMLPVLKQGLTIINAHIATLEPLMEKLDAMAAKGGANGSR